LLCDSDLHRSGADKTPHDSLSQYVFFPTDPPIAGASTILLPKTSAHESHMRA